MKCAPRWHSASGDSQLSQEGPRDLVTALAFSQRRPPGLRKLVQRSPEPPATGAQVTSLPTEAQASAGGDTSRGPARARKSARAFQTPHEDPGSPTSLKH